MGVYLARGIRMVDPSAEILIREGQNVDGDWIFISKFDLKSNRVRYEDLVLMFKNSVESVGGALLD